MRHRRSSRLGGVLVVASVGMAGAGGVFAEDKSADTAAGSGGLEEVVVTASRRAINLQKESREITAISSADLERNGVVNPDSLQNLVPGLTIADNGPELQVSIRGVGARTIDASVDPAVAINVDGVYYPKTYEASAAFFDLERVEVLKGPQGTLYGRNASSGAINLITTKPKFDDSGFAELELGNYSDVRVAGAVNLKFSDVVALRVAGQVVNRDGYLTDGYDDDKNQAGRLSLLYRQADTSLLVTGFYGHIGGLGSAGVIARPFGSAAPVTSVPNPSNPWTGPTDPATIARIEATNPGDVIPRRNGYQDIDTYALTVDLEQNLGWGKLSVLPSYVGSSYQTVDYPALVVPTWEKTRSDQYSFESRLSALDTARAKWVFGIFGSSEIANDDSQAEITPTFAFPTVAPKRNDKTAAAFGEVNYSVTDAFRLIAGLRYTWENKKLVGVTAPYFGPISQFPIPFSTSEPVSALPGATDLSGKRTDTALNYRAGAEYDFDSTVMGYATVATGFKAGGFYGDIAPNNSYKPEKLTAYTTGIKSRFLDNRLQANIEAFYWDYRNKQESFLGFGTLPGSVILLTKNAASARLYGFDGTLAAQISATTRVSGEAEYNNTRYNSYVVDTTTGPINNSGQQLVRAPLWSGRLGVEQTIPIGIPGKVTLNAQTRFSSPYWLSNDFVSLERQTEYQIYDAWVNWDSPGGRISVSAFVRNIGNRAFYTGGTYSPSSLTGAFVGQVSDPRTYGARFRVAF